MNNIQNYGMQNFSLGFQGVKDNALKNTDQTLMLAKKVIGDKKPSNEIEILGALYKQGEITAEKCIQKIMAILGDKQAILAEAREMVYNGKMTSEEFAKGTAELLNTIV